MVLNHQCEMHNDLASAAADIRPLNMTNTGHFWYVCLANVSLFQLVIRFLGVVLGVTMETFSLPVLHLRCALRNANVSRVFNLPSNNGKIAIFTHIFCPKKEEILLNIVKEL